MRFHDVTFAYVPGKPVLHDISLYAKPGQKIAFVGSTGAGKTTVTNLINRFYEIEEGQITFDGIPITRIRKDSLRNSIGMVLQDTPLFTGTVMENIRYGRLEATDEECIRAAQQANAHSFIRRLPKATRPRSPPTAPTCRRGSASCWPSPAPPWPIRQCSSSTRPPAPSTHAPSG